METPKKPKIGHHNFLISPELRQALPEDLSLSQSFHFSLSLKHTHTHPTIKIGSSVQSV